MHKPVFLSLAVAAAASAAQEQVHAPGIELPEGAGKSLLLAECTRCHDLKGLPAYKGYWDATRWRGMVETMVKNGAPLTAEQTAVLSEYLAQHFGKPPQMSE